VRKPPEHSEAQPAVSGRVQQQQQKATPALWKNRRNIELGELVGRVRRATNKKEGWIEGRREVLTVGNDWIMVHNGGS